MTARGASPRVWAIVPAAGRAERFGAGLPKQYAPLLGRPMLEWSLRPLLAEARIEAIVVVVAAADERWPALASHLGSTRVQGATGGASRQASVLNGLRHLADRASAEDWVLVHDAARPCLTAAELGALIDALVPGVGGAILAAPLVDTIKRERDGVTCETVAREGLWRALTPQAFRYTALLAALEAAARERVTVTDEAQAMERSGVQATLVQGSAFNIKVTQAIDLVAAARILQAGGVASMRIGQGLDVHAYGAGNFVTLGGVRIRHSHGVVAHSDGDVLIHALCDALLGALGQGDIGAHFPDTDPRYRGADSRTFLRAVAALLEKAGARLVNADITVLAEVPRIAAHRAAMVANLAADLGVTIDRVNVKATTTERLGFIGRGEGLAAQASVLLELLSA